LVGGRIVTRPLRTRIAAGEDRFQEMVNTVPSILFTADPYGRVDYACDRFYRYTGLPEGDAEGHGWLAAVHPDDRARILNILSGQAEKTVPIVAEVRLLSQDASYRWFLSRFLPVRNADGRISKWFGAATDVENLKQVKRELRTLTSRLLTAQDEERSRIARELHDTTAQHLVAALLEIDQLREFMIPPGEATAAALDDARQLLDQSLRELRTLSYALHPPLLEQLGLVPALRSYARGFEKRSGIRVALEAPERLRRSSPEIETALFRVAQEGLTNISRHARSNDAHVTLSQDFQQVRLDITDGGVGMPTGTDRDVGTLGVGIASMRVRVQQLGGSLVIRSSPRGTTVSASVPLLAAEEHKGAA
jgi:PAS domain S-box-containing protein